MKTQLVEKFGEDKGQIESQLSKAIAAIQKYAVKKAEESAAVSGTVPLIAEPEAINIQFSLVKIPIKKDFRFNEISPMPFPVIDAETKSICLLVRDPKEKAVAQVQAEQLPFEKVIAVKSLKRKYTSIESRKELANRYDLFFCETPIFEMMGKLLGKGFFENKKSKIPAPMKFLTKQCFEKTLRTARFRVRGGNVISVRIGHRGMPCEELVANAMAVVEYMATRYCTHAKTANNIYNMAVGATNVIDLPIWSVPVDGTDPVEEKVEPVVAVETPKKINASSKKVVEKVEEAPKDLAAVPVKKLKAVQKQRVEEAKQQVQVSAGAVSKKRKISSK